MGKVKYLNIYRLNKKLKEEVAVFNMKCKTCGVKMD